MTGPLSMQSTDIARYLQVVHKRHEHRIPWTWVNERCLDDASLRAGYPGMFEPGEIIETSCWQVDKATLRRMLCGNLEYI